MMIYPPIAELVEKTGSRYVLVIEAARRARQLSEGAAPLCSCDSNKEVSMATSEIFQDKLHVFSKNTPDEMGRFITGRSSSEHPHTTE